MSFQNLGLSDPVVHGVQSLGYIEPTPIQEKCIPLILEKKDLIGSAQTGTGKTAAFALPILTLLGRRKGPRCLVLEPTRELALQHGESMAQHENLDILGTLASAAQHHHLDHEPNETIETSHAPILAATEPNRSRQHETPGHRTRASIRHPHGLG